MLLDVPKKEGKFDSSPVRQIAGSVTSITERELSGCFSKRHKEIYLEKKSTHSRVVCGCSEMRHIIS